MSLVYSFDRERLKHIIAAYLNADFNFNEISSQLKKPMRIHFYENIPHIQLSDGYHFIQGHFTKDAINEFRKNHSNTKFTSLRDKILVVSKWRLVKRYEDSKKVLTSYQNISVHFVVESFRPLLYEKPQPSQIAKVKCLFRDSEIQSLIKSKRQDMTQNQILTKHVFNNPAAFEMPSAKDIFASETQYKLKTILPKKSGTFGTFEEEPMVDEIDTSIANKEENKLIVKNVSNLIAMIEVIRCDDRPVTREILDYDREDFNEIKDIMLSNAPIRAQGDDATMIDTSSSNPAGELEQNFYDIKRLLIQERGEEEYYFLHNRKSKQMQDLIDDEITRNELTLTFEHFYQSQEESRLEFRRQIQMKLMQAQEQKSKKKKRAPRYRLGIQASEIKDRILRFMNTYNPNKGESILEERTEMTVEPRERAYSQDQMRNDHSELIETRTINSQHHKGFCLSQFNGPLSVFNDGDITESEHEEEGMDDPIAYEQKQNVRNLVAKVKPTFSLFKKYYEWFQHHEVTTKPKYDLLQESLRRAAAERAEREAALERERLEREEQDRLRELKRQEQERYRQEQYELEQQRKAERKAMKLKMAEDEKMRKQIEIEEQERQRISEIEAENQRLQFEEQLEKERLIQLQKEQEERELQLQKQLELQRQEQERQLLLLQQQEAERARQEEKRRLAEEERIKIEEAKKKAFLEEKERIKRETEAVLRLEKQREIEIAAKEQADKMLKEQEEAERYRKEEERRKHEEAIEKERQKAQAAAMALAAEQERQRKIAEEKRRREEQERAEMMAKLEQDIRLKEEQMAREAAERRRLEEIERKRREEMAIAALQAAGTQSQSKIQSQDDSDEVDEKSSCQSQENERTAAFQQYSQDEDDEEPILETKNDNNYTPSPDQTQNALVMIHQSPGSFVDQNAYPINVEQQSMTLNQVLGTQLGSQPQSNPSSQEKKSQKKRKRASSESDNSASSRSSRSSGRSRSASSSESSDQRSSSSGSGSASSNSSKSLSSNESGSDVDSSSSSDDEMTTRLLLMASQLMKKKKSKSKKSKKDKKSKSKSKSKEMLALLAQMAQKGLKKKKKHSSSSSKKHKHKHSSDKGKKKEERSSSKTTTAFSIENNNGGLSQTLVHNLKQSPSPQKLVHSPNGFKSSHFETTSGSTLDATNSSSMIVKQVSPPPIRISPTVPLERAVTSFDSWKSQNEPKTVGTNGNGFHHYHNSENVPSNGQLNGNHQVLKNSTQAPWEVAQAKQVQQQSTRNEMLDELMQLQILNRAQKTHKRPRHN